MGFERQLKVVRWVLTCAALSACGNAHESSARDAGPRTDATFTDDASNPGPSDMRTDASASDAARNLDSSIDTDRARLFSRMAEARCNAVDRCSSTNYAESGLPVAHDRCVARELARFRQLASAHADASADSAVIDSCVKELWEQACAFGLDEIQRGWPYACMDAFVGTFEVGERCEIDNDCDHGVCTCDHLCAPIARMGESCTSASCEAGSACGGGTCVRNPARRLGERCTRGPRDQAEGNCAPALLCVDGECMMPASLQSRREGESCDQEWPRTASEYRWCNPGLECHFEVAAIGTCVAPLSAGAACGGGASLLCEEGTVCAGPSGSAECRAPYAEGETCFSPAEDACAPGFVCRTSVCVRPEDIGASCASDDDCGSGWCNAGRCDHAQFRFCAPRTTKSTKRVSEISFASRT